MTTAKTTPCQWCGDRIPNDEIRLHVARHNSGELPLRTIGEVMDRVHYPAAPGLVVSKRSGGPAPSHGTHPPKFSKTPPLSDFLPDTEGFPGGAGGPATVDLYGAAADFVCPGCRAVFPQHCAPTCPRQPDALGVLLAAVHEGATLRLHGDHRSSNGTYFGTLTDITGTRIAAASGDALGQTIIALAVKWKLPAGESHDHRCSRLRGAATCDCGPVTPKAIAP